MSKEVPIDVPIAAKSETTDIGLPEAGWVPASESGRRYNAAGPSLKRLFGGPVRRISLDGGLTCPNRDGKIGTGGCLYCDAHGSRAASVNPALSVSDQLARGIARAESRQNSGKSAAAIRYIAYLQAYTHTYAQPKMLRRIYEEALSDPRVLGLAIGARPDCLAEHVLSLLEEFAQRTFLWLEMGLQSGNNATLQRMNRGHTVEQYMEAARRLKTRHLRFCSHVIFGLPGDSLGEMENWAALINEAGAWGVKIHNLYVDRDSSLRLPFERGEIPMLTRDVYVDLVIRFLSRLSPKVLIHRLMGEAPPDRLIAPEWAANKQDFLRCLEHEMERRNVWQGCEVARQRISP